MTNNRTFFSWLATKTPLILVLILFSACNSSSLQVSDGLGGTGVTMGRVTAFGSIYVNGIKFNTDNATFMRDSIPSKNQTDFSTGEIVKIVGSIDENRITGTATEVIFSNVLEGIVTTPALGNTIEVMGQKITTDNLTVFHGFELLADLSLNNKIEISGFVTKTGIIATSIKLITEQFVAGSNLKVEGYISDLDLSNQTFKLNRLNINYSLAQFNEITIAMLKEGLYLIVSTQQGIQNNTLQASSIAPFNNPLKAGVYYEIEGYITKPNSLSNFAVKLDSSLAAVSSEANFDSNAVNGLTLNSHIIIKGTVNEQNVLVAEDIKKLNKLLDVTIEAKIEAIDHLNNAVVILGQRVYINDFTLLSDDSNQGSTGLNFQQLTISETVLINAYYDQRKLIANRLSKIATSNTVLLLGITDRVDLELYTLSLLGKKISVNEGTFYLDADSNNISKAKYFSLLNSGEMRTEVIGKLIGDSEISANKLSLKIISVNE